MTSVQRSYAQRDNRLEHIVLTGYITDNGTIDSVDDDPPQHPAYAAINLTKAKNFFVDATQLVLRTGGEGIEYLLRIYVESEKPPHYFPNFEWNVFIKLPPITGGDTWIAIQIFRNKAEAESVNENYLYAVTNTNGSGNITQGVAAITFHYVNDYIALKSVSPSLYLG